MKLPSLRFFWFSYIRLQRINSIYRRACTKVCNKIVTNTYKQAHMHLHTHTNLLWTCVWRLADKKHSIKRIEISLWNSWSCWMTGFTVDGERRRERGKCSVGDAVKLQIVLFKWQSKISDNDKQTIHLASVYMSCVCVEGQRCQLLRG